VVTMTTYRVEYPTGGSFEVESTEKAMQWQEFGCKISVESHQ